MSTPVGEQVVQPDVLPDSRGSAGSKQSIGGAWWIPIFCANCGASGGYVPEENMTFAFYLCNPCSEKWGAIANTYQEPDAVFFKRIELAQLEKYSRLLGPLELLQELEKADSPLAKLAREGLKRFS